MLLPFLYVLLFFHASEVALVVIFNLPELQWSSLLITQPYSLALGLGVLEHVARGWILDRQPVWWLISGLGMAMIVTGETVRKLAMIQAGPAFTHRIKPYRRPQHNLVTDGVYRWLRHPGYFGWFLWSIGTQVLLCNPICTIAFLFAVCRFFQQRIPAEEKTLLRLFGAAYEDYASRTPIRIPFVTGLIPVQH
eukprot:jgi/Ulvmu1/388/UM001_0395.1